MKPVRVVNNCEACTAGAVFYGAILLAAGIWAVWSAALVGKPAWFIIAATMLLVWFLLTLFVIHCAAPGHKKDQGHWKLPLITAVFFFVGACVVISRVVFFSAGMTP